MPEYTYDTSTKYARLCELMRDGAQPFCLVDYNECRDVARAKLIDHKNGRWEVGARGICYIYADNEPDFVAQCEAARLEFIEPQEVS